MAPTGAPLARVATGAAAVVVAALIGGFVLSTHPRFGDLVDALVWGGVALTLIAVAGAWPSAGVVAALSLGSAFAVTRYEMPSTVDLRTALIGPALLVLCELVAWSCDARTSSRPPSPLLAVGLLTAAGLTAVVAAATTLPIGDALGLAAVGVTAVVLVTAAFVSSARSVASRP